MRIQERLAERFVGQLIASPAGRAHMLNQIAEAEGTDEGALFERLEAKADDAKLAHMIRRHQEDEQRHARLFHECLERTGVSMPPVPDHLKLLGRIDQALGRDPKTPPRIETREDVMRTYLVLQVIEERATVQFALFGPLFRRIDPETSRVFEEVARDEARHLRYCHAISRRYAPDEATRLRELARLREIEARCFADNSRANVEWIFAHGYVRLSPAERLFWRSVGALNARLGRGQPTGYERAPEGAVALAA